MRTVTIAGTEYLIRAKEEVTWRACRAVEDLVPQLFFKLLNLQKFVGEFSDVFVGAESDKRPVDSEEPIGELFKKAFTGLLADTSNFVQFLKLTEADEEINELKAVMLVTNLSYADIQELPAMAVSELITVAHEELGSYEDFTAGLHINTQSTWETVLSKITVSQPQPETSTPAEADSTS